MDQREFQDLLERYALGHCTTEEKTNLENWLNFGRPINGLPNKQTITRHMQSLDERIGIAPKQVRLWPKLIGIAAALIIVMSIIWTLRLNQYRDPDNQANVFALNDIAPGRNGATLKLSGGKYIALDGEKSGLIVNETLRYLDGSVPKQNTGINLQTIQQLTAETGRGQVYNFTLPDGTKVYLNAASSLTFPSKFEGATRNVQVQGEAYFEVAKDKAHPFIVSTFSMDRKNSQSVKVLGTHFNINAYGDQGNIKTTLEEGSVSVAAAGKAVTLVPGEQSRWSNNTDQGNLYRNSADLGTELAWRKGNFAFKSARLDQVMKTLSRWYDVEVVYEGDIPGSTFSGAISRDLNASEALDLLNFAGAKFRIEGRKIIVSN